MKKALLLLSLSFLTICPLRGDQDELSKYEKATTFHGNYDASEKVFRATFPRTDVPITIDGQKLDSAMGLSSWSAFKATKENSFMVMGDFLLFEDEVDSVISSLLGDGLHVTAIHNHFFFDQPKIYFVHIGGEGELRALAQGVKNALHEVSEIRSKTPKPATRFDNIDIDTKSHISLEPLETILKVKGQSIDGMAKFVIGKEIKIDHDIAGKTMGVNTWIGFVGSDDKALMMGDMVVTADEVQKALKELRDGGIHIVALHNHMLHESPRLFFIHFWAKGKADYLAGVIQRAL